MKNETHIPDFEYLSQENIEEFPVPQGSYNDKIIIEDDSVDPLKIINPPEIIEKVKKKKKHSKHNEQKKPKHVSKSKRKRDNIFLNPLSTSDIYDLNMSQIQRNIIPADYNLMPVSVSISNELNKKTINKVNINQLTNRASTDNRKDMAKSSISIVESRPIICSSTNDRSDFSKTACIEFEKNSYAIAENINIGQKASRYFGSQIKQLTNMNYKNTDVMSPKRSTNNNRKTLIQAPRLILKPSDEAKPQTENQQTSTVSKIDTNNVMDTKNPQYSFQSSVNHHQKPPVLKNEMEVQYIETNSIKSPPSLEISMQVPNTNTVHVPNTDCTSMFYGAPSQYNRNRDFKSGIRMMGKMPSTSDASEKCMTTWPPNNMYSNSSKVVQEAAISEQDFIQISRRTNISPIPKSVMIQPSQCSTYALPPPFMPVNYVQHTNLPPVMNILSASACNSKQTMLKVTKSASRQRSQKGTSRRKPSAKSNKSNNSASSNTSQVNITSTSVGTQINSPIDSTWNLSDPNIQSRITSIQNASHESEHSNMSDNKDNKLQDSQKQRDNIHSHLLMSKGKIPSILKKKPKEKKATTRRKQLPTPIVPVLNNPAIITSATITPATVVPAAVVSATVAPSIVAPIDVAPAVSITMAVTTTTIAPAIITPTTTIAPMSVPATVAPAIMPAIIPLATVAPVIEAKDQSTSTQFTDAPQLCNQPIPVIPGHMSEMIYPNIPNDELLKAFNNYWSAQVSHCAICATFASCTSGSSRMMPPDWKYCESTTLPESTPIWVRK